MAKKLRSSAPSKAPPPEKPPTPSKPKSTGETWQLKVTLRHLQPVVWRRFMISNRATLAELHDTLQLVIGWSDSHLHDFEVPGWQEHTCVDGDDDQGTLQWRLEQAKLHTLGLVPRKRFRYTYDFGDCWRHDLMLERVLPLDKGALLPICVAGSGACPLEDSGGPWGYPNLLATARNPKHPQHKEIKAFLEDHDPEAFSVEEVNQRLHPRPEP